MRVNRCGFITNYLVSGPRAMDFINDESDSNQLRYEQYLRTIVAKPCREVPERTVRLGAVSTLGLPWEYYYSYENWFVDKSNFYSTLQKVELDAVTELDAGEDMEIAAVFWTYAALTVWCNGECICVIDTPVYKPIQKYETVLKLRKGTNQIYIRLQTLGVRDTRTLFGIQILPDSRRESDMDQVRVTLPDPEHTEPLYGLEQWLAGIWMKDSVLTFSSPAPAGSMLGYDNKSPDYGDKGKRIIWESVAGRCSIQLDRVQKGVLHIAAGSGEHTLTRTLENIDVQVPENTDETDFEDNKNRIYRRIADTLSLSRGDKFGFAISNILARKALGRDLVQDEELLWETLAQIETRYDCSDFLLCGMIRCMKNYSLSPQLEQRAREVLLNYRYWMDQEGSDAMCFWSENHSLMFYTCAMNAGDMYPDEYFPRAGKTGRELCREGREKVRFWLSDVEEHGFEEFLSTVYMCVTFAALLNVVDYSDDDISCRAVKVTDTLLTMLAKHTFDGCVLAPMGRVYREVIHPFQQGAQALMNLIDPRVPYTYGEGWLGFYATSRYEIPADVKALMHQPVSETYSTGNALICLDKKNEYCVTSVQSPRLDPDFWRWENLTLAVNTDTADCAYTKSLNERFHGTTCFEPGVYGYQQHMWYAALDRETDVFTNHPGGSCEGSSMRPGFWYGNGVMPAIAQKGNRVGIVYHIPNNYPIHFVHAYFPAAKFEETRLEKHWLFGKKKDGYLALWCSLPMEPAADQLFGCEFRSYGDDAAYVCVCERTADYPDFDAFAAAAKQIAPDFDADSRTLMAGELFVRHTDSGDQTQYV